MATTWYRMVHELRTDNRGDLWYTFGLAIASIPAGSVMYYCHEWLWDKVGNAEHNKKGIE